MRVTDVFYYAIHPQQAKAIFQWKLWHHPVHERDQGKESVSLRICYEFLAKTSRSFVAVILELHPELLAPIAIFYLILRGLDTIEDDMTLPLEEKDTLLRNFYNHTEEEGWNFSGSGPQERDRDLLVNFEHVVEEFRKLKPAYQEIIKDITKKMGNGMADFANNAEYNANGVDAIKDYDLYCHYVAGLVGEGCTRLFVESKLANPALLERPQLHESMGLFLQKTNIIRDIREDFDDNRRFWPKEIWSKHVDNFADLFKPDNLDAALNCSSEMVLNSLSHASECLSYLAGLKEQSVFNFCAIPQSMAIATLDLVFRNPLLFQRNIKITRGESCQIMIASTQNLQTVCDVFRTYVRKIHQKNTPRDPNFLKISLTCGKIEQFLESLFPSQGPKALSGGLANEEITGKRAAAEEEAKKDSFYMLSVGIGTLLALSFLVVGIAYFLGKVTMSDVTPGRPSIPSQKGAQHFDSLLDRKEL